MDLREEPDGSLLLTYDSSLLTKIDAIKWLVEQEGLSLTHAKRRVDEVGQP